MTPEQIAHVAHEANRALQIINGDSVVSPHRVAARVEEIGAAPDTPEHGAVRGASC